MSASHIQQKHLKPALYENPLKTAMEVKSELLNKIIPDLLRKPTESKLRDAGAIIKMAAEIDVEVVLLKKRNGQEIFPQDYLLMPALVQLEEAMMKAKIALSKKN